MFYLTNLGRRETSAQKISVTPLRESICTDLGSSHILHEDTLALLIEDKDGKYLVAAFELFSGKIDISAPL